MIDYIGAGRLTMRVVLLKFVRICGVLAGA